MNRKSASVSLTFSLALFMILSKVIRIVLAQGSPLFEYPVLERFRFEYFVWDIFELVVWVPALIAGALLIRKKNIAGNLVVLGVSSVIVFQWSAVLFGMINYWTIALIFYIALAGAVMISNWRDLPVLAPMPSTPFSFYLNSGILALVLLVTSVYLGGQMYARLIAGGPGLAPEVFTTQPYLDYADASLNEPLIFLVAVVPLAIVGIYNLPKRNKIGYRTALSANVFLVGFLVAKIMTGPVSQALEIEGTDVIAVIKTVLALVLIAVMVFLTRKLAADHELIRNVISDDFHTGADGYKSK